jgi:hypothetical protein
LIIADQARVFEYLKLESYYNYSMDIFQGIRGPNVAYQRPMQRPSYFKEYVDTYAD